MEVEAKLVYALDRVAEHRLDNTPLISGVFWDMWGEPKGEIHIGEMDVGLGYAIMSPFVIAPTIAEVYMVGDVTTLERRQLSVTRLAVDIRGATSQHWLVKAWLSDNGTLVTGKPRRADLAHPELRRIATMTLSSRLQGVGLHDDHTYEFAVKAAIEMVERLGS